MKKKKLYSLEEQMRFWPWLNLLILKICYIFIYRKLPKVQIRKHKTINNLYVVRQGNDFLNIHTYRRYVRYLISGISGRMNKLVSSYFFDRVAADRITGSTILDVGANVGEFSIACLNLGASKVIAVEPDPIPYSCLKLNLSVYDNKRVNTWNKLLSDKIGETTFYISSESADSSLIEPSKYTNKSTVLATTIDSLWEWASRPKIQIIKIEAEGAEPEVLLGGVKCIHNNNPIILIDVSPERRGVSTYDTCRDILASFGYKTIKLSQKGNHLVGHP